MNKPMPFFPETFLTSPVKGNSEEMNPIRFCRQSGSISEEAFVSLFVIHGASIPFIFRGWPNPLCIAGIQSPPSVAGT